MTGRFLRSIGKGLQRPGSSWQGHLQPRSVHLILPCSLLLTIIGLNTDVSASIDDALKVFDEMGISSDVQLMGWGLHPRYTLFFHWCTNSPTSCRHPCAWTSKSN